MICMATPPLRRRAGMIEIKEKQRKAREEAKKQGDAMKKEESSEERAEKERILREAGLIK